MRNLFCIVALVCLLVACAVAQTYVNGSQLKSLVVSPIVSVERYTCTAKGTGFDCSGLQMIRLTLADGTVLGPYVAVPTTIPIDAKWQSIPLSKVP